MSLSDDTYDRLFYESDYNSCSSYEEYMDYESDKSEAIDEDVLSPMKELDRLCKKPGYGESDRLSIDELKKLQHTIPKVLKGEILRAYHKHPFFHNLCMNKNVTLEMVQLILGICPDLVKQGTVLRRDTAYPLHCACENGDCPDSVVKLILDGYPEVLLHSCVIDNGPRHALEVDYCEEGNPLMYYIARRKSVNLTTVKMLVDSYPKKSTSLVSTCTYKLELIPIQFLLANSSIDNHLEIASYLLEAEPETVYDLDRRGRTLLHLACMNSKADLALVQFLYNKMPEAIQMKDNDRGGTTGRTSSCAGGKLPIHKLCDNYGMDEKDSLEILRLMLSIDPSFPEMRDIEGSLPMHDAAIYMRGSFCKVLMDAYPESLKVFNNRGKLPIHLACGLGNSSFREDPVYKIDYMLQLYPELSKIGEVESNWLPIHNAAMLGGGITSIKSLELLIKHDPASLSKLARNGPNNQVLPIQLASIRLDSIQAMYDAYPDAILSCDFSKKRYPRQEIVEFEQKQREYAMKAKDKTIMTTVDGDGWLPLHFHHALKDNAPLGSIKLLLRGNPAAVHTTVQKEVHPLHIACEFSSAKVVEFLLEDVGDMFNKCDVNGDSPLHYACRSANVDVIKYLVAEQSVPSVSEVNTANKLPIHLLLQCENETVDRESPEFIDACFHLFRANPESIQTPA